MNILSHDQQIAVISCLCDGLGIRATARVTGVNRETVGTLAFRVGRGCAELHDRMMVGIRTSRLELDELWAYVGRRRRWNQKPGLDGPVTGDQYTFIALAASTRAIVSYRTGKRTSEMTDDFVQDLRQRVIGTPEISSDGWLAYPPAIRDAFGKSVAHGIISKTYSVTHLTTPEAARRYSPAAVVAVSRDVISGVPAEISTSYVERQNLSVRMASRRFTRLRLFKEAGQSLCGGVAIRRPLQPLPRPREPAHHASGRAWHRRSGLDHWRLARRSHGDRPGRARERAGSATAVSNN
jgi:IS1 family transposase